MHRKRNLLATISLVVLVALLLSACSGKKDKVKLSEMEDSELLQALTDFGVEIPENVGWVNVRWMIAKFEEDPGFMHVVSHPVLIDLYEDLRSFVIYYQSINN